MSRFSLLFISLIACQTSWSQAPQDARDYLADCLPLNQVKLATQSQPTQSGRTDRPQPSCSYNDAEVIAKQTVIRYSRDPAYNTRFNIPDLMQSVEGLGQFAEYEEETGLLYVNVGPDGIVFEGRQGKNKLSLAQLTALATAVLSQHKN